MADLSITASAVVPSPLNTTVHVQPASTLAGEALSAGDILCLLDADSKYYKADANDTAKRDVRGIAGNSAAAAAQRVDVISQSPALTIGTHGIAVGTPLFLSNTSGKLCPLADLTTGSLPVLVAYTESATTLQIVLAAATAPKP